MFFAVQIFPRFILALNFLQCVYYVSGHFLWNSLFFSENCQRSNTKRRSWLRQHLYRWQTFPRKCFLRAMLFSTNKNFGTIFVAILLMFKTRKWISMYKKIPTLAWNIFLHSHHGWEGIGFMWKMTFDIFIESLRFETPWVIKKGFYESVCLSVCRSCAA